MALPSYTLNIVCGNPFQASLAVLTAAGSPVSQSALESARAQVRPSWNSGRVLHEWSTSGGNAAIGSAGVTLTGTVAETIDWQFQWPDDAVWDLRVVDTSGTVHRLTDVGPIQLYPVITR